MIKSRAAKLVVISVTALIVLIYPYAAPRVEAEQQRHGTGPGPVRETVKEASPSYSRFSHNIPQHKQECSSCHSFPSGNWKTVRKPDEAIPDVTDYPQHSSCLNCHRQQFFSGARPAICSICHINPSPSDGRRHPFPNPPEAFSATQKGLTTGSEFDVSFPHDKHLDLVGEHRPSLKPGRGISLARVSFTRDALIAFEQEEPKSCAVCHNTYQPQGESNEEYVTPPPKDLAEEAFWLKKGTFKTTAGHSYCFTCHSQDGGLTPAASDCGTCHKLLSPALVNRFTQPHDDFDPKLSAAIGISDRTTLRLWSRRESIKFRHEWAPHEVLSCTDCHNAAAMNTLDRRTAIDIKSCAGEGTGCHIEKTSEGILNSEIEKKQADPSFVCSKCHINNGRMPAPETHLKAVAEAKIR